MSDILLATGSEYEDCNRLSVEELAEIITASTSTSLDLVCCDIVSKTRHIKVANATY